MMTTEAPPKPELSQPTQAAPEATATIAPAVETEMVEVAGGDQRFNAEWPLNCDWPREIGEAYARGRGPYTVKNVMILLEEEPLELYNGWLVWQEMTDLIERGVAANIQEILSIVARARGYGRGYPDQVECYLANENVIKPDVCIISDKLFEEKVRSVKKSDKSGRHLVLHGAPELVVETRSPSNRRGKEKLKRQDYFDNGTQVIWDVEPKKQIIWVYEAATPDQAVEYQGEAEISCEALFPGWKRKVADFFNRQLSAEQIVGEEAAKWRAESRSEGLVEGRSEGRAEGLVEGRDEGLVKGRAEGELETLKRVLLRQSRRRFGNESLPADLESRLDRLDAAQLEQLTDTLATSPTLYDWLATFPPAH